MSKVLYRGGLDRVLTSDEVDNNFRVSLGAVERVFLSQVINADTAGQSSPSGVPIVINILEFDTTLPERESIVSVEGMITFKYLNSSFPISYHFDFELYAGDGTLTMGSTFFNAPTAFTHEALIENGNIVKFNIFCNNDDIDCDILDVHAEFSNFSINNINDTILISLFDSNV